MPGEKANPLLANGAIDHVLWDRCVNAARIYGIAVTATAQYGVALAGTATRFAKKESTKEIAPIRWHIKINDQLDGPSRYVTLAHELGHIYCGHQGRDLKGRWPTRTHLTRVQRECEAEAVAWLVGRNNGITSQSSAYLTSSFKDPAELAAISLYAIFETTASNREPLHETSKPASPDGRSSVMPCRISTS